MNVRHLLLDKLGRLSWQFLVEGSPLTGSSQPTTSTGQPLEPSWNGQCWKRHLCKCCRTVFAQNFGLGTTTSWWTLETFLATPGWRITLNRQFPTYHVPWPAFEAILVRSVLKETSAIAVELYLHNTKNKVLLLLDELGTAIPSFWTTLGRLFLTYHNSWSAFGAILDRSVMRKLIPAKLIHDILVTTIDLVHRFSSLKISHNKINL